jgi:hypothetical protein
VSTGRVTLSFFPKSKREKREQTKRQLAIRVPQIRANENKKGWTATSQDCIFLVTNSIINGDPEEPGSANSTLCRCENAPQQKKNPLKVDMQGDGSLKLASMD